MLQLAIDIEKAYHGARSRNLEPTGIMLNPDQYNELRDYLKNFPGISNIMPGDDKYPTVLRWNGLPVTKGPSSGIVVPL